MTNGSPIEVDCSVAFQAETETARALAAELATAVLVAINHGDLDPINLVISGFCKNLADRGLAPHGEELTRSIVGFAGALAFQLALLAGTAEFARESALSEEFRGQAMADLIGRATRVSALMGVGVSPSLE